MANTTDKTEDQIAKDKEAVKAMTGAKAAMEAAIRRVELLEAALKSVRGQAERIGKAFGPEVHLNVYSVKTGRYEITPANELFATIDETIKKVL